MGKPGSQLGEESEITKHTADQQAEFEKLKAVRGDVLRDPAVASSIKRLRKILPEELRLQAEHPIEPHIPDAPGFHRAFDRVTKELANSLKRHGIGPSPEILQDMLLSAIPEGAHRPAKTPEVPAESRATPRLGGRDRT